jgi:DNA-directed RNA polymerase subunit beta'
MLSSKNILGPKDGRLILSPSQDMVLGMYYLTIVGDISTDKINVYDDVTKIENDVLFKNLTIHSPIIVSTNTYADKFKADIADGYKYFVTTVGRIILNNTLPSTFPYINEVDEKSLLALPSLYMAKKSSDLEKILLNVEKLSPFKKNDIHRIVESVFERYPEEVAITLDAMKEIGFTYSTQSGTSMSIFDIIEAPSRKEILDASQLKVTELGNKYKDGYITDDQRYLETLSI